MASRNIMSLVASAFVTILFFAISAFSQGAKSGGITGIVKDPHGGVVVGANVEIYNEGTATLARSLGTEADGSYTALLLPPGSYRVEVTAPGFKKYRGVGVPVRITETTRHDVTLQLGELAQSVVIEATPTLVNTENATTGQPVDSRTLTSLPLASPNFLFLLALSPGAAAEPVDVRNAGRGNIDITVNGQRTTNNSVSLEGINVNDFNLAHFDTLPVPDPFAIEEFKVATSLYDASQGTKGGGAVDVVLKSGTKDLHGNVYWQHRNDVLNANEWFRNQTGSPRARLLQNVFGASGGGPVWKLGGFWFANYQGVRARNGIDPNGSTLTPTIQNFPTNPDGTTSAALLAPAFGLTSAQIDPIAVNILNLKSNAYGGTFLIPRSGQPGCLAARSAIGTFTCTFSAVAPVTDNQFTISYDGPMRGGKDKLGVRWFYDNGNVVKPFGTAGKLAFPQANPLHNRFLSIAHTHLFSARQTNEFRFGYTRFNQSFTPTDLVTLADIGATRPNASTVPGIYFFDITGLFTLGTGVNDQRATVSNAFFWADTWSMTAGKHTFRSGTEIIRYQLNRSNEFAIRGSLTFGAFGANSPFANFLQGRITSLQSGAGDPQRYFRTSDIAMFFQDDWRIHPRFTLNLGLRYELLGSAHDLFFRSGIYDPTLLLTNPPRNPFLFPQRLDLAGFRGTPGVNGCVIHHCYDNDNFAPRVGFAWDVLGAQRLVVRGGYGIYFQQLSNQNLLQGSLAAPFFVQLINQPASPPPLQLQNPLAAQPPSTAIATTFIPQISFFAGLTGGTDPNKPAVTPLFVNQKGQFCQGFARTGTPASQQATNCVINLASFASSVPNMHAPYTQQWNLTVQHELWGGWAVELGYVGSHYVGGLGIRDPFLARLASPSNPIVVTDINRKSYTITTNTPANEPLRHEILGLSRAKGSRYITNEGQAIYHSAQVVVSHRFHRNLFFQGAYTFSKEIDNVSGAQSTDELNATRNGQLGANFFQNDPRNRARGDFDRPHRLVVSYAWDLPVPKSGIWGSQAFQGWTISGIVTYQNGLPFSVLDSNSGRVFGNVGGGTGVLVCAPTKEQIPTLPMCVPGTPTTVQQALLSGSVQSRLGNYINPNFLSAAPNVPNGTSTGYGNIPRNAFRGPFQQNWDFSVAKAFRITERQQFEFRSDFFNLWNHPVFDFPATVNISSRGTLGQIRRTVLPARLIQFGLRFNF
jgi:hypothetical protein